MGVELHETGAATAPTTQEGDERIGLALLQLLAEAADSHSAWVNRRVAKLEFLDTRAVRWLISVDCTVSETAPLVDDAGRRLLPITSWRKSGPVTVDFRDEQGTAIPLITAEETTRFMTAALYRWAAVILERNGVPEPGQMLAELRKIVSEPPDRDLSPAGQAANAAVKALLQAVSAGNAAVSDALFADKGFRSNLYELSENFIVLGAVADKPGARRVLKLAFESGVDFQPRTSWAGKALQRFGWRDWPLQVMLGGRGGSCHLEVSAPPGVDIVKIVAEPAFGAGHPQASKNPDAITTSGKTPHVGVRVPPVARRYRATIYLHVNGAGWLSASWLVALVIAASMSVGRSRFAELFAKGSLGEAATASTLLLALLGVFASYLIRPGEHPLAALLLRSARELIMIDVTVVLVAVGDLLLHPETDPHQPKGLWDTLACVSGLVALLLIVSLAKASWPWSTVTTKEAAHDGCADLLDEAAGVPLAPEGVQLRAPDGTSYGDTEGWGRRDQRALVDSLHAIDLQATTRGRAGGAERSRVAQTSRSPVTARSSRSAG